MARPASWSLATAFLLVLLVVALALAPAEARPARQMGFGLNPPSGPPGMVVTVSGGGWTPNSTGNEIHWDSQTGPLLGTFNANGNGAFSTSVTIPDNASGGGHSIWACDRCHVIIAPQPPRWASATFTVILPPTPTPRPTPTPIPPSECDATGMAGETVIDFESFPVGTNLRGQTLPEGVTFDEDLDADVVDPAHAVPRSGSRALQGDILMEFRSSGVPIRFTLGTLAEFVGVFVGLDEPAEFGEPLTAELVAYGLDEDGHRYLAGRDSVALGPGVENIHRCLSVSDPRIYEVFINYPTGDPELIDNLILRYPENPEVPPPDDEPPHVTILAPEDYSILSSPSVRLEGEVIEDRQLERIEVYVNGVFQQEIGFSFAGDTADGWKRYIFALEPVSGLGDCYNEIVVRVYDAAGYVGMDLTRFTVLVGDLTVTEVEPVQVIFGAPLVRGKNTAFRAHVTSTFRCPVEVRFRMELDPADWHTGLIGGYAPWSGIHAFPVWHLPEITLPVTIPGDSADLEVMLPVVPPGMESAAWDAEANPSGLLGFVRQVPRPISPMVDYAVEIDPENEVVETDETNNRSPVRRSPTVETRGLNLTFIPWSFNFEPRSWETESHYAWYLRQRGYGDAASREADVEDHLSGGRVALTRALSADDITRLRETALAYSALLLGGFPVAEGEFEFFINDLQLYFREDYFDAIDFDNYCDSVRFLSEVRSEVVEANPQADFAVLLLITGCCGQSPMGPDTLRAAYVDSGITWPWDPQWYHDCVPAPTPAGAAPAPTPTAWPFPMGGAGVDNILHELSHTYAGAPDCYNCWTSAGSDCASCVTDADGFWVNEWQLFPEGTLSVMHAISQDTVRWWRLDPILTDAGAENPDGYLNLVRYFTDSADPQALLVRGTLARDGQVAFFPFSVLENAFLDLEAGSQGTYVFVLKGGDDRELIRAGFSPTFEIMLDPQGIAQTLDEISFVYRIPWDPSAARIELQDAEGNVLAWRAVSAHPPTVEFVSPSGGETWTWERMHTVRWQASDPDGDALVASIQTSLDGGGTWLPLAAGIERESYRLDAATFAEGQRFLLRVVVSDEVRSASATSAAELTAERGASIPQSYRLIGVGVVAAIGLVVVGGGLLLWRRQARRAGPA